MNEELNKKLAEWAGFEYVEGILKLCEGVFASYYYVKDEEKYAPDDLDFTDSLDACFKWLLPKVSYFSVESSGEGQYAGWARMEGISDCKLATAPTPALALCLAIEKLIDKETK